MSTKKLQIVTPIVTSVNGKTGDVVLPTDSSLSSTSENPVQNKVVNSAISDINALIGASSVSSQISAAVNGLATETYVNTKVAGIVNSAPETLDTLNELAAALGNDPNFATTVATQIGTKVDKVNGKGLSTNDYTTKEKNKLAGIEDGANKTTVDSAFSSTSTNPVQNKVINAALNSKVSVESGKGLSTNDYTTAEKTKLSGIAAGATKVTVDSALSSTSTNPVQNKVVNSALSGKLDKSGGTITGQITLNDILVLSSATYGDELPATGVIGQVFFKKVWG
ncbi:MAG: hypothetical protein PUE12_18210 [Oscillospiraceae bacterium]|nr:hypothetical protein [Oscillospiraceae bacterium]